MKILALAKAMGVANALFGFILFCALSHAWQARLTDALLCSVLVSWAGFTVLAYAWVARGRIHTRQIELEIDPPSKRNAKRNN